MPKVIAIIQARLGSERLPNKVLLQIPPNSGVSMLEHVIRKAMLAKLVERVLVVTPDMELWKILNFLKVEYYIKQWEGRDVLREFYDAARCKFLHIEDQGIIVRLTADCPLLQPEIIDQCVSKFLESNVDLVYNSVDETGFADGQDVEVFSFEALKKAYGKATRVYDREHVTSYVRKNMRCIHVPLGDYNSLSVDTYDDYVKVCEMM